VIIILRLIRQGLVRMRKTLLLGVGSRILSIHPVVLRIKGNLRGQQFRAKKIDIK
jgi:hypothetical protein